MVPVHGRPDLYSHEAERVREQEEWERRRLQRERERERERERNMKIGREGCEFWQMDKHEKEILAAEHDVKMDRMRDGERRGMVFIERYGSRRGTTYDDRYMSGHRRDPGYYY